MKKRIMGWLLALLTTVTLLPVQALAADLEQPETLQRKIMYRDAVSGEMIIEEDDTEELPIENSIATYEIVADIDKDYNYNDDVPRYGYAALGKLEKASALQYLYFMLELCAKIYDGKCAQGWPLRYNTKMEGYEGPSVDVTGLSVEITPDDAWLVASALRNDHPELFWLVCGVGWSHDCNDNSVCDSVHMYYCKYDIPFTEAKNNFESAAKRILADMPQNGSDYDKEKYLHDALVKHVNYNEGEMDQGAYTTLVKGEGVCAGYARAFQYLLQCSGIESFVVTGGTTRGRHAWDIVKLNDKWYFVDPTWDDASNKLSYTYFNRGTEFMLKTHKVDPEANVPVDTLYDYISDEFAYTIQEDGSLSVGGYRGETAELVIPERMKGMPVTTIQKNSRYLFGWNSAMKSVALPNTVTTIDSYAFEDCTAMEAVFIPASVTEIRNGAFAGCEGLKDVYYTGTKTQWRQLTKWYNGNSCLTDATIHYVQSGDLNGSGSTADVADVQCLYAYLTTGDIAGALNQREGIFRAMADVNGDGSVDVYDLQRMYETVGGIS